MTIKLDGTTKRFAGTKSSFTSSINDRQEQKIIHQKRQLERWSKHFKEILNRENVKETLNLTKGTSLNMKEEYKVKNAIKELKKMRRQELALLPQRC